VRAPNTRRLFLDGVHIADSRGLIRRFHAAEKQGRGPVLVPDAPWERAMGHNAGTVLWDGGRFRYWYQVFTWPGACEGTPGVCHAAYAESEDGVRWTKPHLGAVRLTSGLPNNLTLRDVAWINVIRDAREPDPVRRYKMLAYGSGREKPGARPDFMGAPGHWGWCLYYSPDGLRWEACPQNPVFTDAGDVATLVGWDDDHDAYVAYPRSSARHPLARGSGLPAHPPNERRRLIGRNTSVDLVRWTPVETVLAPNELDTSRTEFYGMPVARYHGHYLGLLYVLYGDLADPADRHKGLMDIQLAASRDGISWTRLGGQQPLISRGLRGSFDAGMVGPNAGVVARDGRLWFLYNGWTGEHRETKAYRRVADPGLWESGRLGSGTGLATLREDGFVSLDAGEDEGTLTTPAERVGGADVWINAATEGTGGAGGGVTVALCEPDGTPVPGFGAGDCDRFAGDSVAHRVTWNGRRAAEITAGAYALRFALRRASLFGYWIDAAESPVSSA
jgi:hypothetical protein